MRTQEAAQGEAGRRGLRASGRGITWSYSGSCKWTSENSQKAKSIYRELPVIGFLRSSPLWNVQKFAFDRIATPGSTSLNVTFADA